jgi:hypothetical protein
MWGTAGGHLRVVRWHGYRVVPKWSPEGREAALLGAWADVGAAVGEGEDQALLRGISTARSTVARPMSCSCCCRPAASGR